MQSSRKTSIQSSQRGSRWVRQSRTTAERPRSLSATGSRMAPMAVNCLSMRVATSYHPARRAGGGTRRRRLSVVDGAVIDAHEDALVFVCVHAEGCSLYARDCILRLDLELLLALDHGSDLRPELAEEQPGAEAAPGGTAEVRLGELDLRPGPQAQHGVVAEADFQPGALLGLEGAALAHGAPNAQLRL